MKKTIRFRYIKVYIDKFVINHHMYSLLRVEHLKWSRVRENMKNYEKWLTIHVTSGHCVYNIIIYDIVS